MVVVYEIVNLLTGSKYIGSTQYYKNRKYQHLYVLKNNKSNNTIFQNDFNFYGEDGFAFNIISKHHDIYIAQDMERKLILNLPNLYNIYKCSPRY